MMQSVSETARDDVWHQRWAFTCRHHQQTREYLAALYAVRESSVNA
jgi:hypothetical protein